MGQAAAILLFLMAVAVRVAGLDRRIYSGLPLITLILAVVYYVEHSGAQRFASYHWTITILESVACFVAGFLLLRSPAIRRGHGSQLLAGAFLLIGLHGLDRPYWLQHPYFLLRIAFDHILEVALGIAMVVVVLESERTRGEELNDKMRRLSLLTAASTQTLSVQDVIDQVLAQLVGSLDATHGMVRLKEGEGKDAQLVARASVGYEPRFLAQYAKVSVQEPWAHRVLKEECHFLESQDEWDPAAQKRLDEAGLKSLVTLALPGKNGPLGVIAVGTTERRRFAPGELSYLVNMANLLGMTLENVRLFEQVATVRQQWEYTFDSIGDPILVHDGQGRVLRSNQRLRQLLGREREAMVGWSVGELLPVKNAAYKLCPYCEEVAGEGDNPDPWLPGYFLASNSRFADPSGRDLGTVHVLKDITDRKRAEEKYRTLVSNVQEGVFISTPQGRFLDFNDALLRMSGYETREELLAIDIPSGFYKNAADRERLQRLLQEHGAVADFEFEMRRKDGEARTMLETSFTVRDAAGNATRSEEHTSELQSRFDLVCRLLLEKKKKELLSFSEHRITFC